MDGSGWGRGEGGGGEEGGAEVLEFPGVGAFLRSGGVGVGQGGGVGGCVL